MLQRLNALLNAAQTICSSLNIEEILESLTQEIRNIMEQTDAILIFLYDDDQKLLVPYRTYGIRSSKAAQLRIAPGETIAGTVFQTKKSILLPSCSDVRTAMSTMSPGNLNAYQASLGSPIYPESVICVPLLYRSACLGVITIDRFIPDTPYTAADAQIFESIANLASTAIANSRMYQQLNHSIAINKALAVTSLRGQGLKNICEKLSEMLRCQVAIYSETLELLSFNEGFRKQIRRFSAELQNNLPEFPFSVPALKPSSCIAGDLRAYVVPISDGTVFSGYAVYAGYPDSSFSLIQSVSELSGLLLAIELMRLEREQQLKESFIGESLSALLEGHLDAHLLTRLQKISPDITQGKNILVLMDLGSSGSPDAPDSNELLSIQRLQRILTRRITFHSPRPIYMRKDTNLIALYTFPSSVPEQKIYQTVQALYTELRSSLPLHPFQLYISCGRVAKTFMELPQSLTDARLGMQYLHTLSSCPPIVFFHQLGIRKLLFRHDKSELKHFYLDTLGPVIQYDQDHHGELLTTLTAFKQNQRSMQDTVRELNIHKNTLAYRLRKIRELLDLDGGCGHQWSDVDLALDIKAYLEETNRESLQDFI